jgi:hypothetical protein
VQITTLLSSRAHNQERDDDDNHDHDRIPIPDVLAQPDLLQPGLLAGRLQGLDWRAMFEGVPQAAAATATPPSPGTPPQSWNLCLGAHHSQSPKGRRQEVGFDIDSVCCFPTSLAVARLGLRWLPQQYQVKTLKSDVHLQLKVRQRDGAGHSRWASQPLNRIRHYSIGEPVGIPGAQMLVFFRYMDYFNRRSSGGGGSGSNRGDGSMVMLTREDEIVWTDEILLVALSDVMPSSNAAQHYPPSAATIKLEATAESKEAYVKGERSRERLITYDMPLPLLGPWWDRVCQITLSDPRYYKFSWPQLFLNAKNMKLCSSRTTLPAAVRAWQENWDATTDPAFYSPSSTWVDLAKQSTSQDSGFSYTPLRPEQEPEVYLGRKCCLDSNFRWWAGEGKASAAATASESDSSIDPSEDDDYAPPTPAATAAATVTASAPSSPSTNGLRQTWYPWATLRDAGGQTISFSNSSLLRHGGLAYIQIYNLVKGPFEIAKVFAFDNPSLESIALDPSYIKSLHYTGGAVAFDTQTGICSYLHTKERVSSTLRDNRKKSLGLREEFRLSLALLAQVTQVWGGWVSSGSGRDTSGPLRLDTPDLPLPFFILPTTTLFDFLYWQINKYCLLFEHVLSSTQGSSRSLAEVATMVLALRSLRFSYSSKILAREYLLFRDRWEVQERRRRLPLPLPSVREGIGMGSTMKRHGIGWFLPKMDWDTCRIDSRYLHAFLTGDLIVHDSYKKRFRRVRDLQDIWGRLEQASQWFTKYQLGAVGLDDKERQWQWLEYLICLNINQFDLDLAAAMHKSHQTHPELVRNQTDIQALSQTRFCYTEMSTLFYTSPEERPPPVPPHANVGNRGKIKTSFDMLSLIFNPEGIRGITRQAWKNLPFRLIYVKTCEIVQHCLGEDEQRQWQEAFFFCLQLTHWVLPYATGPTFLSISKSSRPQGLTARTCWFSSLYTEPPLLYHGSSAWPKDQPRTLQRILEEARSAPLPLPLPQAQGWRVQSLVQRCRVYGLTSQQLRDFQVLGRQYSARARGNVPLWEHGTPPQLLIAQRIQDKTAEELDSIFRWMLTTISAK